MLKVAYISNLFWNNGSRNKPLQLPDVGLFKELESIDPIMTTPYSGWMICEGAWNYAYLNDVGFFLEPISIIDRKGNKIKYALIRDEWAYAVKTKATVRGRVTTTDNEELLIDNIQRTKLIIENPSYLNVIKLATEKAPTLPLVYFKQETFNNFVDEYLINGAIDAFKQDIPVLEARDKETLYIMRVLQTVKKPSWKREIGEYIKRLIRGVAGGEYTLSKVTQQSTAYSGRWTITPKAAGKNIGSQSFENHVVVGDIDLSGVVDVEPVGPDGRVAYGRTPVRGENAFYKESAVKIPEREINKRNFKVDDFIHLTNTNSVIDPVTQKTASPGAIVGGFLGDGPYETWVFSKDGILKPFRATKTKEEWILFVKTEAGKKVKETLKELEDHLKYAKDWNEQSYKGWDEKTYNRVKREESEFTWDKLVWELPKKGSDYDYSAIYDLLNHNRNTLKSYIGGWVTGSNYTSDITALNTPSGKKYLLMYQYWYDKNKPEKWSSFRLGPDYQKAHPSTVEYLDKIFKIDTTLNIPNEEFIKAFSQENDQTYNNGMVFRPSSNELSTTTNYFRLRGTDYTLVLHNGEASLILPDTKVSATTELLRTDELESKLEDMELLELINQKDVLQIYDKQFELKDRMTPWFRFNGQVETITPKNTLTAFDSVFVYYDGFYDYLKVSVDTPRIDLANVNTNSYLQYENLVIEQQRLKEDFVFKKEQVQLARSKEDNDWQYRWDQFNRSYTQTIANIAINAIGTAIGTVGGIAAGGLGAMMGASTALKGAGLASNAMFQMMDLNAKYNQMKDQEKQMFAARILENHGLNIEHHRKLFDNLRNIRYMGSNYTQSTANNYDVLKEYNKKIDATNYHLKVFTPTEEQLNVIKEHFNYHGVECAIDDVTLVIDETLYGIWMMDEINAIKAADEMSREYIKGILTNGIRILYEPLEFGEPVNKTQPALFTAQINEELAKLREQCERTAADDYEQLKFDKQTLETQLAECNTAKQTLEEQVRQLTAEKQSLEQRLQAAETGAESSGENITRLQNELAEVKKNLAEATRNLETAKTQHDAKVAELEKKVRDCETAKASHIAFGKFWNDKAKDLESKLNTANAELRKAASDAHSKGEAVTRLTGEVEAANKKITELTTKKEELDGQILKATAQVAQLTSKKEELEGQLLETTASIAKLTKEKEKLGADLDDCIAERDTFKEGQSADKKALEDELAKVRAEKAKVDKDLKDSISELDAKNTELGELEEEVDAQKQIVQHKESEIQRLKQQLANREADVTKAQIEQQLNDCNAKLAKATADLNKANSDLSKANNAVTTINRTLNTTKQELATAKQTITTKEQALTKAQADLNKANADLTKAQADKAKVEDSLTKMTADRDKCNRDKESHKQFGVFWNKKAKELETKLATATTDAKNKDTELQRLRQSSTQCQTNLTAANRNLETFRTSLANKERELTAVNNQVNLYRNEAQKLKTDIAAEKTKVTNKDLEITAVNTQLSLCKEQLQKIKTSLADQKAKVAELQKKEAELQQCKAQVETLERQVEDEKAKQTGTEDELQQRVTAKENELEQVKQRLHEKELELGALKVEVGQISSLTPWERYRRVFPYSRGSYTKMDEWRRQFTKENGFNLNPEELKRVGITVNALAAFGDWEKVRCVVEWQIFNRGNATFQTKEPPSTSSYFSNWNEDIIVEQLKDNRNWTNLMDTTMNPVTDHQNVNYGERTQLLGGYGAYYYWKNTRDALNKLRGDWQSYKVIDQSNSRKPGLALRILESTYNSPRDKVKATNDVLRGLLNRACSKVEDGSVDYTREFNCPTKLNEANQKVRELTAKVAVLSAEPDFPTWEQYEKQFKNLNKEQWLQKFTVGNSFRLRMNTFNDYFLLLSSAYRLYKGQVLRPTAADEEAGYKRLRATVELALKNEGQKTIVTGKNLPLQWNLLSQEDLKLLRVRAEMLYQYVRDGFNVQPQTHINVKNKFNDFVNMNNRYTIADFRNEKKFLDISKKGAEFVDALLGTNKALRLWTGIVS